MNNPLQTLLELREFLAQRAQYHRAVGRLVPNAAQQLLLKLDELIDQAEADRELEQREAILDQRVAQLRKESQARDFMEDKE